jgi:RNA polymerase sigma-70 factor, ECF subfamily
VRASSTHGDGPEAPRTERALEPLDFADVYETWFHEVTRWIRALGGPHPDLEDLAQEVFIVVERKLPRFDGRNLPGWLYTIARNVVSDHRRRAFFRNLFRRRALGSDEAADPSPSPAAVLERKEAERIVDRALARMGVRHRAVFILFEIEGYSGEEIARLEGIPVATVWSRLHYARKQLFAIVAEIEGRTGPNGRR